MHAMEAQQCYGQYGLTCRGCHAWTCSARQGTQSLGSCPDAADDEERKEQHEGCECGHYVGADRPHAPVLHAGVLADRDLALHIRAHRAHAAQEARLRQNKKRMAAFMHTWARAVCTRYQEKR